MHRLHFVWTALLAGCLSPPLRRDFERLEEAIGESARKQQQAPAAAATPLQTGNTAAGGAALGDDRLVSPLDLALLIEEALRRNPALHAGVARSRSALEEVRRAGTLDDPVFKAETERVPLSNPVALDRAEDNMFGFEQTFPFPGKLDLRAESALHDAEAAHQTFLANEREVVAGVKRVYYEYFLRTRELEIHRQHVEILEEFERITEARYRTGAAPQQDLLKSQVELVRLHNNIFTIERHIGSARSRLNALLDRPAGAPLGPPRDVTPTSGEPKLAELLEQALAFRPELLVRRSELEASRARAELAHRDAVFPDVTLGLDYWQVPRDDDAYGGFLSFNLPWLTGKRFAEARKMEHAARAADFELASARNLVVFEVQDAHLRVEEARRSVALVEGELRLKARQSVDVARSNYEKGASSFLELLDAERSQRDVEITYYQALAAYESALADLERAVGRNLEKAP